MSHAAAKLKDLLLAKPALTLAAAESLTCGRVQAAIGGVSGASNYFLGGITAYALDQKVRHLGVSRAAAKKVNSVSADIAEQMASGVCSLFGSDLGVATTGYAEPSPADRVAEPFAYWAVAHRQRGRIIALRSGRVECPDATRVETQSIVADAVIAELIDYLEAFRG
jgi:nicotinamide-nucleotide amidase